MKPLNRTLASLALALTLGTALHSQDAPAMLVADAVFLEGDTRLVAEGRVEALAGDTRIIARKIIYDRATEQLSIQGPIRIEQAGGVRILASSAEMDAGFQNAILRGARLVLDQQVQLAAYQMNRVNGRYSQLYKASVTSCQVCTSEQPPLWQIRARRVIHDQAEKQLYFEGAQLRVRDMPVFYLPYLRLPDPTLERASGFMIPSLSGSSTLGAGINLPYFIKMGDHRDLTLTPSIRTKSRSLGFTYRQAFFKGDISFEGAISRDDQLPGETRAYLFAEGAFDLRHDFKLSFDLEATRDDTYLVDYGFSDKDRLDSSIAVTRAKRDSYTNAALVHYHTLRVDEDNATIPSLIADFEHERRYFPSKPGGELRLSASIHSHYRTSDLATDSADDDDVVDGRDVKRLGFEASWRRSYMLQSGLQAQILTGLAADQFYTSQDVNHPGSATELTPMAALALRWPLQKFTANGIRHVVEPFVQLGWVGGSNADVANDESTRVEFDEGNLLSLSHFPAPDRRERGESLTYGVNWSRTGTEGWESTLTLGHILRSDTQADFSNSSGLSGRTSDLLVAGQISGPKGMAFIGRALFDSNLELTKAEARGSYHKDRYGLSASYVWLDKDPDENRTDVVAELSFDGLYRVSRHWSASTNMRFDITAERAAKAGLGLQYRNECMKVDLSLSRRFTSSTILSPSTDVSLTVGLLGFNASSRDKSYARQCKDQN